MKKSMKFLGAIVLAFVVVFAMTACGDGGGGGGGGGGGSVTIIITNENTSTVTAIKVSYENGEKEFTKTVSIANDATETVIAKLEYRSHGNCTANFTATLEDGNVKSGTGSFDRDSTVNVTIPSSGSAVTFN